MTRYIFRASASFPAIETTRILFMGLPEIGCVATLRSKEGEEIGETYELIKDPRAYRIEAKDLLPEALRGKEFEGNLEVAFYSAAPLDSSHPAVVAHTYGPSFSTVKQFDKGDEPFTMVPLSEEGFTNISCSRPTDLEIYERSGKKVFEKKDILKIDLKELGLPRDAYGARLIAQKPSEVALEPCKITLHLNPQMKNPATFFKWLPVLADQPRASLWLFNSSPEPDYSQPATIELKFHREQDNHFLERPVILPPHGFIDIEIENDPELKAFFDGKVGWATLVTNAPYLTTYYFAIYPSGAATGNYGFSK